MRPLTLLSALLSTLAAFSPIAAQQPTASATATATAETVIEVDARQPGRPISRFLTGACIEDVNHEIYGGLYSQMIFGERFQEPTSVTDQIQQFVALGGVWKAEGTEIHVSGNQGDKLVSNFPAFQNGEVGVEVYVPDRKLTNSGLVVRVANARRPGADNFDGYEIALNAERQSVLLGRHHKNFEALGFVPCEIPIGQWVPVIVKLQGTTLEIIVNGKSILRFNDVKDPLHSGTVGLRQWQSNARYRNLWVKTEGKTHQLSFESAAKELQQISGMWRAVQSGTAEGQFQLTKDRPFIGEQSQRLTHAAGQGRVGLENQGLNRWGMNFLQDRDYNGLIWARATQNIDVTVALESVDGTQSFAEQRLSVSSGVWQRLEFRLTSKATSAGRFSICLNKPGTVDLGYTFLQPGEWGRFKGLPVRKDVADAMLDQGLTVLRYGGSMINHPEYRWKKMIGPHDRRPPHRGTWYPFSTNGWGIIDFLNFCEAANLEAIPAFNMDETPEDLADFVRYAKSPVTTEWGQKRAADGHPEPYRLRYLQLGNEERVNDVYLAKFRNLAEAIWKLDPDVTLVVGDFDYREQIRDPYRFGGTSSGITTLAPHEQILKLAKEHQREVWFDVHVWTDGPRPDSSLAGTLSLIDALEKLADGARFKVAVFELNSNSHGMRRALANALAIQAFQRDGRLGLVASANALQPDGQNDNGWNQGLVFLNPSQVWLQPPGYVTQMYSRHYQPRLVSCQVRSPQLSIDATASQSDDGKVLNVYIVNPTETPIRSELNLAGFTPSKGTARLTELAAPPDATNTAAQQNAVIPRVRDWTHQLKQGKAPYTFTPFSVTVISWE